MSNRVELHNVLSMFMSNVYFQPPSDKLMNYPCIVYQKLTPDTEYADNEVYRKSQEYQITVIEHDPDSTIADELTVYLPYSAIASRFVKDGLHHTHIKLYY